MPPTLASESRLLSEADRCDRCGAQAFIVAVFDVGQLAFCAHHGRRYSAALATAAVLVHDESDLVTGQ